jgi:eukaryotic-like serine/threonine-protein kinase
MPRRTSVNRFVCTHAGLARSVPEPLWQRSTNKMNCLAEETLRSWLAGSLDPVEADTVCTHVHDCARCQSVLDRQTEYSGLRRWLDRGPETVAADLVGPDLAGLIDRIQVALPARKEPSDIRPPAGRAAVALAEEPSSDIGRMGSFRLLNELGRGGMGIVYRAWDESLHRLVALKVLRPEQAHETDRLRLVREARLTAQFRHDHAVTVHAVAIPDDGLPYLVMEYVQGPTLAELIDSPERPEPRAVATLIAEIADALDAAHAVGLVHRDVKPGNILIENGTGRAKITDFGLARAETGPSSLSREGFLAGTPTYMSPEQARGDALVDARADVYGLGATFYQALTGVTPYRGAPHLVLRQVIDEEPVSPRRLNDRVPRDLETICLKAMAKERARRYPTAAALAGDLRRWLKGEPIQARPVGRLEWAYRLARRNSRVTALAAALVIVFTAGFLGVVWQWQRAERNLRESQVSFERARGAVDHFYTRFYEQGVLKVPGLEKVRREVLGEMIRYYKNFVAEHRNDPALRLELAKTCERIGNLTKDLGNKVDALAVLREAVQYYERLPADAPEHDEVQVSLYRCLDQGAQLEADLGDIESARRDYQRAFAIVEKIVRKDPGNIERTREMGVVLGNFANLSLIVKDKSEARRAYLQALEIQKDLVARYPADLGCKNDLALTYNNLFFLANTPQEGRSLLDQALTLRKQLVEVNPGNTLFRRHLARTYESLGRHQISLGQNQDALRSLRESRALLHQVVIEVPNSTPNQDKLASACALLGYVLNSSGQYREAQEAYKEARTMYQSLVRSNPENPEYKAFLVEIESVLAESENALKTAVPGSTVISKSPAGTVSRAPRTDP